ncbi:MAG: hypothetical protein RL033_5955 [Pseudomonadota bacterium]
MTSRGPQVSPPECPLPRTRARGPRSRLLATLRVLAVLTVLLVVSLWALLRTGQARAADVLVQLGQQLMRLPDAQYGSGVQQLWVNGLELQVQSGSSANDAELVVAQFRRECSSRAALQLGERERQALAPMGEGGWFGSALDGVLVEEGDGGTAVVCIDPMGKPWDVLSVAAAAQRFVASGDLLELGRLRYAFVRRTERGSAFLTMWTESSTRLLEQFPHDQDAPGRDFPDLARVAGSQRFLSASLSDSVLAIYAHRAGTPEELAQQYRSALELAGYRIQDTFAHGKSGLSYAFLRGARQVQLTLGASKGLTLVSLISLP